ncbi:flagellin [Clostridium paraputrificum]|uniref:flagellin n=1 Tax=Clostridium TaxID=1485 RepID=UPI003D342C96
MRLNHNMNSLGIYNTYKKNLIQNSTSIDRISSGTKINSAKDNPSKIGQSENMRIQLKSLQAAQRNLQDGASMVQATDSALQEANNILARMKELAVSAADGTKSDADKLTIQNEIDQMKRGIDDLANNTEFNGVKLIGDEKVFNNDYPSYKETVIGAMVGEQMRIPTYNISSQVLKDDKGNRLTDVDVVNKAADAIYTIDKSITEVSNIRGRYGAIQSRFETSSNNLEQNTMVVEKAESSLRDTDIAIEMAELARTQILNDTSLALIAQSNQIPQEALRVLERVK